MLLRWPIWLSDSLKWLPTLPSQCLACHAWPSGDILCRECWQHAQTPTFRCSGCALALPGLGPQQPRCGACLRSPPLWQHAHAWVDYHYPWNTFITRWKFGQEPALAQHFARWMGQDPQIQAALHAADVVVSIPLSAQRLRERGYNPAAQLARQLATDRYRPHALVRNRHTAPQSDLPRALRLRNVRHAFEVPATQRHHITGQRVLVMDDVMTTGATCTVASRVLLEAGAAHVQVLCMARTP